MPDETLLAIGCYTERMPHVNGTGRGIVIAALHLQTGALTARHVVEGARNPSYLAPSPASDRLYAVEELDPADAPNVVTYALDRASGALQLLAKTPSPGAAACHIIVDRTSRFLLVSNFSSGDLLCYRLDANGIPQDGPQIITRPGNGTARVHCAIETPEGGTFLVCDAGNDTIAAYALSDQGLGAAPAYEIAAASGSFPRHVAVMPDAPTVLVANEHSAKLGIFRLADGGAEMGEEILAFPADWTGTRSGAAVRIHPNGRYGYMSTRGHDSIIAAAIDHEALGLTPIGIWKSGGRTPRDFAIDPSGRWLVAAHQASNDLVVFSVNAETGALEETGQRFSTGTPVSILFL